jgi:Lrp/AsnC family transcriptional regulator, leucine-responsive regulatory protein
MRDFPCQPKHVKNRHNLHAHQYVRHSMYYARQSQPHQKYHQRMAKTDAEDMGDSASKSEICTRCHKHHVVWSRSNRGDKGKAQKGEEQLICHAAIISDYWKDFIANNGQYRLFAQLMGQIDDTDRRILRALSRNGRISNLDLAERIGLSPSACLRRVQELERIGIIKGYRAVLDSEKLGLGFIAYMTVGLSTHTKASQAAFEQAMMAAPEVRECHNITGTVEYLLRVEASDLANYKHFHTEVLGVLPMLRSITSYVVLSSPKDDRG